MVEFQCAVAARERDEPMFATASQVRRWLLIEVRGAWGPDAVASSDLTRHTPPGWRQRLHDARIRVIAIRRDLDRTAARVLQMFYVESGGGGGRGRAWRRRVATLHTAVAATSDLPLRGPQEEWQPHRDSLVLVCTNGRHDPCCATFGRPLARALRLSAADDNVWECSHIGGDRFAGNIVILPEGLYYGRCDESSAAGLLAAYKRGEIDLDHYRGRSAFGFYEQAAEYFTRRQLGLTAIDAIAAIHRTGEPGEFTVDAVIDGEPRTLRVSVARAETSAAAPLTCTGPVGLRVPSYRLIAIEAP
jgi:hypothetical protein